MSVAAARQEGIEQEETAERSETAEPKADIEAKIIEAVEEKEAFFFFRQILRFLCFLCSLLFNYRFP